MSNVTTKITKKQIHKKMQPQKVKRIVCPKCGELQIKIYPWSSFELPIGIQIPTCKKCLNSTLKSGVA